MKYLNLTEGFNPYNAKPQDLIDFEAFTFSGGEPHIKIKSEVSKEEVSVSCRIQSFNDLGLLMIACDALRGAVATLEELKLLYFPGARQDRRMVKGEPLTVKVYANLINSLNFKEVTILDPHSDVTPALINNVRILNNNGFVLSSFLDILNKVDKPIALVSPDAGANKKLKDLAVFLSDYIEVDLVKCDKTRDVKTGEITGFEICSGITEGKVCVIVDDICDGGGTFVGLAEEIRKTNPAEQYLVVTHGIFSKGFSKLNSYFDGIYTTNSFAGQRSYKVTEISYGK